MLQGRELASEGDVLGGQLRSVTEHPTDEQEQDTNRAHFTASNTLMFTPRGKRVAAPEDASNADGRRGA
jgi:hypothetical protein